MWRVHVPSLKSEDDARHKNDETLRGEISAIQGEDHKIDMAQSCWLCQQDWTKMAVNDGG